MPSPTCFLAALSSSWSLVVCPLVGWLVGRSVGPLMFMKKWPLEYQKLVKTYLPTYVRDSGDSRDSSDLSDSSDSSD